MFNPNLDCALDELVAEQISIDRARRYLTQGAHTLDEATVNLTYRYLDNRQAHLDRKKQRLYWS